MGIKPGRMAASACLALALGLLTGCAGGQRKAAPASDPVIPEPSTFFATVSLEEYNTVRSSGDGDLWPSAWADDGFLYAASGDGTGFGDTFADLLVSRIDGTPEEDNLTGITLDAAPSQVWTRGKYNRKPTGMACVDGVLYCAVQDLSLTFDDVPAATICRSDDKGKTWTWDTGKPMFKKLFTTVMFLDYGRNYENAPDGYVYAYGLDYNWRASFSHAVPDPTGLFLARVDRGRVMDRAAWEFYCGTLDGEPAWTPDIAGKTPVLRDERRVYADPLDRNLFPKDMTVLSQGSVTYNKPLDRYLYCSWTEYTFEFYESPTPWGPWKLFLSKDVGAYPWHSFHNGGYATTIPSKFISGDGQDMWVQSNTFMGGTRNYTFSLRKLSVTPYAPSQPGNKKGGDNLAQGDGAVPIARAARYGNIRYLHDGDAVNAVDSWTGTRKNMDYWGYTFPKAHFFNTLVYTTGRMSPEGGWLEDLTVEVRQDFEWRPVEGLVLSPAYEGGPASGAYTTYTLTFQDIAGDGIRIAGKPGGSACFSSISELEVYFLAQ